MLVLTHIVTLHDFFMVAVIIFHSQAFSYTQSGCDAVDVS